MIIETALVELAKAGGTELFISSSESLLKKVKTAKDIKQLFINTGEFFVDYENDADQLFDDMANVLSKENMTKLANELKDEPGYKLKDRLLNPMHFQHLPDNIPFLYRENTHLVHIHGFYILIIYLLNTNQIHQRISLGNYYVRGIIFQHLAKVMTK